MPVNSILIKNGYVLTMNPKREIIRDGTVYVEGDRIRQVGRADEVKVDEADLEIDAKGKIVMPGLIDTHVHLAQALIRGCADDVSLVDWLKNYVWVLQGNFTKDDGKVAAELCMAEMIRSGTTSFVECMIHTRYGFDGIVRAVDRAGMRAALSKIIMDSKGYADNPNIMHPGMVEDADACLREAGNMISKWHWMADGRIQVWYGLRSLGAVSPKLFKEVVSLARLHKTKITMHLGEVTDDVRYVKANGYGSLVGFAKDMGLLGPQTVFAHGIHFEAPEIDVLAATKTNISHCPSSNTKLASGFAKIPLMLQKGVPVSIGCDGGPSNNTYDMIREMRMAATIHKAVTRDPVTPTAEQVIEMATLGGASAMGIDNDVGSLAAGKLADVIVISQKHVGLNPVVNPVSNLVYAGSGRDVETVIVSGKVLMEDGQLKTLDEQGVIEKANDHVADLLGRSEVKIRPKWPVR